MENVTEIIYFDFIAFASLKTMLCNLDIFATIFVLDPVYYDAR